jgi:hypothetical protein
MWLYARSHHYANPGQVLQNAQLASCGIPLIALKLILILSNAPAFILCKSVIQQPTIAGAYIKH